jgi:hypothetical protein
MKISMFDKGRTLHYPANRKGKEMQKGPTTKPKTYVDAILKK